MATCLRPAPLLTRIHRSSVSGRQFYDLRNKISAAYNNNVSRNGPSAAIKEGPGFMARSKFERQKRLQRTIDAGPDFGVKPTKWQRYFLVVTKLYRIQDEIPLHVSNATMNRMHDRMRILTTSLGICGFFILIYYWHYANAKKVIRDRNAGYVMKS